VSERRLQGPGFPDDDGRADHELRAALAAYDGGGAEQEADVLGRLAVARLLVPVVAVLGDVEVGEDGLARDKTSDMAAVLLEGADGRLAMLAFTGTDAMAAWDPAARPVPVSAETAAQAALQERAAALVVDIAGPATYALEGDDLVGVASGWTLTRLGGRTAWLVD